jgi:hypothetical protein
MNRFVISAVAIAIAAGPASAQSAYRYFGQTSPMLRSAAGNVGADGTVQRGTGFTASRLGPGEYEIRFARGYFSSGCAAMVVEGTSAFNILSNASQKRCQRQPAFRVNTYDARSGLLSDESFQFVAVEENS